MIVKSFVFGWATDTTAYSHANRKVQEAQQTIPTLRIAHYEAGACVGRQWLLGQ